MQSKAVILAVDDEQDVLLLIRRVLERAGHEVITASNGNQALEMVAQWKPDVVLLDIKLPGKSGMEVLEELRKTHPDTAVVMATAVADVSIAIKALTDGASGYLNKPFNINELVLIVERALERRRLILSNREHMENLEKMVRAQTESLEQKVRELTALNNLFSRYLNESFEAADKYDHLAGEIISASNEIQSSGKSGTDTHSVSLAAGISKLAEEIKSLAKQAQLLKVGVQASSGAGKGESGKGA
ncbi:MAG: response regulator [Chloroflexi bacterium]|nr:response regulator [Chloroflexota bacterium]